MSRRVVVTCVLLFAATEALLAFRLQFPKHENFDEFHYVHAARALLARTGNTNWEHPPLSKYLIAVGIRIAGDHPVGWRLMPTLFGALAVVGMYLWARTIFHRESTALWVALISLVNHFLFVTARIAMLDVFMFTFMLFGMVAVCALWNARDRRQSDRLLLFAGGMFGLAMACKWSAVAGWAFSVVLIVFIRLLQATGSRFFRAPRPGIEEWYSPETFRFVRWHSLALRLVIVPIVVYFLTFVPLLWVPGPNASWSGLLRMQNDIIRGQEAVNKWHPYSSFWWEWPVARRPMWYAYDPDPAGSNYARGVLLLGNPAIMWGGLAAVAICLWHWLRDRSRTAFFGFTWYAALYLSWTWVPRTLMFYYYYFPAAMALGIALGYVVQHWERFRLVRWGQWLFLAAAILFFASFYSVLAAVRMPTKMMPP